ncbi:MAG: hypothetical protein Q8919_14090 [Bacteroidota bacterium]|nr:hypothetical protein [Bacteroidota bacterium]
MRKNILTSPAFLSALFLLLLNDLFLKSIFHNWLTGKLSDFVGLFIFALFWIAFFPQWKKQIVIGTAVLFVLWKSPLSAPLIEFWSNAFYPIDRVIDYSDLFALIVLPFAYYYSKNESPRLRRDFRTIAICIVSLFAFCATSRRGVTTYYEDKYYFTADVDSIEHFLAMHGRLGLGKTTNGKTEFGLEYCSDSLPHSRYDSSSIGMSIVRAGDRTELVVTDVSEEYTHANPRASNDHFFFDDMLIHAKELGFIEKKEPFAVIIWLKNVDGIALLSGTMTGLAFAMILAFLGVIFNRKKKPFLKLKTTKISLVIIVGFVLLWAAVIIVNHR